MNQEKNQMTKSFFSPAFLRPVLLLFLVLYFGLQVVRVLKSPQNPNLAPGGSSCADRLPPTPVLRGRHHIGAELERLNFTTGAELGVQAGLFAHETLKSWPRCQLYILVDVWSQQTNYKDQANVDNSAQEGLYQETMKRLEPFKEKLRVFRMFTSEAAKKIPDESLDYIYVDARHDYCGAKEDIELYWPKLRKGGLMAGHDYLVAEEVPGQDWAICQDGSRHPGAVKGAVDEFAAKNKLQVTVTYQENMVSKWCTSVDTGLHIFT